MARTLISKIYFILFHIVLHNINNDVILTVAKNTGDSNSHKHRRLQASNHTSNYAIIVQTSVFFHNYRHSSNALSIYHTLKKYGGFTDDNIILFLGDEVACNTRNPIKDSILPLRSQRHNRNNFVDLYDNHVEVDYGGEDVTVDNFLRVLTGRHHPFTPPTQKLPPMDKDSNLFIYMTGHGGDEFFKFRDTEELTMKALRMAFDEMQWRQLYNKVLFITDTCQAFTIAPSTPENDKGDHIPMLEDVPLINEAVSVISDAIPIFSAASPAPLRNVYTIGSSLKDLNSYSHHSDSEIGHSVIDRYVFFVMTYMGWINSDRNNQPGGFKWNQMDQLSVKETLVDSVYDSHNRSLLGSDVGWTQHGCDTDMDKVPLSDFMVMRRYGHTHNHEVDVEVLKDGVDFTQQLVNEADTIKWNRDEDVLFASADITSEQLPRELASTPKRWQTEGQEASFIEGGTNPTDPVFVISVLISMFATRYLSSHLW